MEIKDHSLLINNKLDFESLSDAIRFIEAIEQWKFVMLLVRKRYCERCYKYKMFSPLHITWKWWRQEKPELYTSDIYMKIEHCKNWDLWSYSSWYWFTVEKIMKIYTLEEMQQSNISISQDYIDDEADEKVKEILISIKK